VHQDTLIKTPPASRSQVLGNLAWSAFGIGVALSMLSWIGDPASFKWGIRFPISML
jgi:hypothetical protein